MAYTGEQDLRFFITVCNFSYAFEIKEESEEVTKKWGKARGGWVKKSNLIKE